MHFLLAVHSNVFTLASICMSTAAHLFLLAAVPAGKRSLHLCTFLKMQPQRNRMVPLHHVISHT